MQSRNHSSQARRLADEGPLAMGQFEKKEPTGGDL
jgi:hypothetical protein